MRDQPTQANALFPELRVVCIDSLNTFGDRRLTRDELCRLFDLFRHYGVVGVYTVESGTEAQDMASSDLVDVLIRLQSEDDLGYYIRYLEIAKSRYYHQIYGRHPFKIRRYEDVKQERAVGTRASASSESPPTGKTTLFQAVKVFPSLHHVVAATDPIGAAGGGPRVNREDFDFGIEGLRHVLSPMLKRNTVLAIVGESSTYKTPLSRHFLLHGLCGATKDDGAGVAAQGESCLLIRLHEQVSFDPEHPWMLGTELAAKVDWKKFKYQGPWLESSKLVRHCYAYSTKGNSAPWLFEIALKGGAILPEEFLQYVRNVVRHQPPNFPIKRVVIDDVALIGASYPFLRRSKNAGDLFLSAFVHVMRNYGTDVVLIGTRTGLAEADEMVNRACALADEILTCEYCDVFGDRYVTIRGRGLAVGAQRGSKGRSKGGHHEMVPPVISHVGEHSFRVDSDRLVGLAGFGSGRIHRPGLTLHTFEENQAIHGAYNEELREIICTTLGVSVPVGATGPQQRASDPSNRFEQRHVDVVPFGPRQNQAFHDGLELMVGPVDKTIVATVDEFFTKDAFCDVPSDREPDYLPSISNRMKGHFVRPYYASVLMVAYNPDYLEKSEASWLDTKTKTKTAPRITSWRSLLRAIPRTKSSVPHFVYDNSALETGACLLLDIFRAGKRPEENLAKRLNWPTLPSNDRRTIIDELAALATLTAGADKHLTMKDGEGVHRKSRISDVPRRSSVYVFWYSQLRDLIRQDVEEGGCLTDTLRIAAPPGRGFTGDWYIGVVGGSVSASLGGKLVKILCAKKEEHKRLERGVGIPTDVSFYDDQSKFVAWPGSEIPLSVLKAIHEAAGSRSEIPDYQQVKTVLYGAWQELRALGGRAFPEEKLKAKLSTAVARWSARISALTKR